MARKFLAEGASELSTERQDGQGVREACIELPVKGVEAAARLAFAEMSLE